MTSIALPPNQVFPHAPYYSMQPFLAWCLNHHFYNGIHYVWASQYLFPFRKLNPKSSNPYEIFRDLYEPCVARDPHDAFIQQKRTNLRAGVHAVLGDPATSLHKYYNDLMYVCDHINATFFWPVLYLIDSDVAQGGVVANSGLAGSDERLIKGLREDKFTIVFPDFDRESPLNSEITKFVTGVPNPDIAINTLLAHS